MAMNNRIPRNRQSWAASKRTTILLFVALAAACGQNAQEALAEPVVASPATLLTEGTASSASSVRNLATLRALSGTALPSSTNCNDGNGQSGSACCVLVHGFADHSDGGGGVFCYKPGFGAGVADNGGTIIKPSGVALASPGRWIRYNQS